MSDNTFKIIPLSESAKNTIYQNYKKTCEIRDYQASTLDTHYVVKNGAVFYIGHITGCKSFIKRYNNLGSSNNAKN